MGLKAVCGSGMWLWCLKLVFCPLMVVWVVYRQHCVLLQFTLKAKRTFLAHLGALLSAASVAQLYWAPEMPSIVSLDFSPILLQRTTRPCVCAPCWCCVPLWQVMGSGFRVFMGCESPAPAAICTGCAAEVVY